MVRKYPWAGWQLALVDAVMIWVSFFLSYYLRYEVEFLRPVDEANNAPFEPFAPYATIFMLWSLLTYSGAGLYEDIRDRSFVKEFLVILNGATNAAVVVMALSFLLQPLVFSRLMIVQATIIAILLLAAVRLLIRMVRDALYRRGIWVERVLVIGAGETGRHVIRTIVARRNLGYQLVGFVDDDPQHGDLGRVPLVGKISDARQIIKDEKVDVVIITLPWQRQREITQLIQEGERRNLIVRAVPDLFQLNMSQVQMETLGGIPLLGLRREVEFGRTKLAIKRVVDVAATIILLPLVLPIMAIAALAIRLDSPGPILFTQERSGLDGQPFKIYKFRSMIDNAEKLQEEVINPTLAAPEGRKGELKNSDPRITRVGRFIRRTSIDELPQFFNVLRGDMSLVGPRPAMPSEVELYQAWHRQRLRVRPGITGLWQVSGRSDVPFEEKCLLDIYYIENWTLGLDLQILAQTAPQVLFGRGAY